jgi:hypothetical protein
VNDIGAALSTRVERIPDDEADTVASVSLSALLIISCCDALDRERINLILKKYMKLQCSCR